MKKYYLCMGNGGVYTENEMRKSINAHHFCRYDFELVGSFRNRKEAEAHFDVNNNYDALCNPDCKHK